jgi:hypothetical protein
VDPNPANARLRRRARRGKGEFGLHLAVDPFPERVRHSCGFITQRIAQQFSDGGDAANSDDGIAAYDETAARTEGFFFGTICAQEAFA